MPPKTAKLPQASFLTSAWQPQQFPSDDGVEVAFAGRSNAGKSSALNALTGRNGLARTSKTPGRTQLINFFGLSERQRLVDLPGYGFAKVPQKVQQHWQDLVTRYVETRAALVALGIVMDARHPLTDFDVQMLAWARAHQLAAHVLLTKADKLSRSEATNVLREIRAQTAGTATTQLFSAVDKTGVDEARHELLRLLQLPPRHRAV